VSIPKNIHIANWLALVVVCITSAVFLSELPPASASSPTVLVPLYDTSGSTWDAVIQAKQAHPNVPIVAIINNFGGPGSSVDTSYATLTQRLHSVGISVIGYTYADYSSRASTKVMADMDKYKNWYNVDGIFIDQMAYSGGDESYYSDLTIYAKSIGLSLVIGNPGTETLPSYVGTVDAIVIYENPGVPSISSLGGWHTNYDKTNWGVLPYGMDSLDYSFVANAVKYVGYIGMGNGVDPNAWEPLPPYFGDLVAALDILQPPTGLVATAVSPSEIDLSWSAPQNNGGSISGYKIERSHDDGLHWGTIKSDTGSSATSYSNIGLPANTTYTYRVSAINPAGPSSPSNTASATTLSGVTIPQPPTGLAATASTSSEIDLSWSAPGNDGGSPITGYQIERSQDNGNTWSTVASNTGSVSTTYRDTGLSSGTSYTYRVSAINSAGTSLPSNTTSASTSVIPTGIVLNNVQSTSGAASNQITLANFNAGAGNNGLLVVGVSADSSDVGSITFNGISLLRKAGSFVNNDAEFWYLKNPVGTGDIVVTMNGPTSAIVGAYSFSGVNQTSPLPTSGTKHNTTPNSPNITITTKFANDWVLDLPSIYGGSTLGSPACTQGWDVNVPSVITGASSYTMVQTPGAVTCDWTASSGDFWDDAAVEIQASR
jgi:hypothetical protein